MRCPDAATAETLAGAVWVPDDYAGSVLATLRIEQARCEQQGGRVSSFMLAPEIADQYLATIETVMERHGPEARASLARHPEDPR